MTTPPPGHHLLVFPSGEATLLRDYRLLDLATGLVQGTIVREARTVAELEAWLRREPLAPPHGSR